MGQAGCSERAFAVGLLSRVTVAVVLTAATVVHGSVVGEHLSEDAPAGLLPPLLVLLGAVLGVLVLARGCSVALPATARGVRSASPRGVRCGVSELVATGVCAVSPVRPGRTRPQTVPRGRARLVPTVSR